MGTALLAFMTIMQLAVVVDRDVTLAWDYPELSAGVVDEFRVYLVRDPAELADLTLLTIISAAVPATTVVVPDLDVGQWYAVATAFDFESGLESPPSSVYPFFVLGSPINFRAIPGVP